MVMLAKIRRMHLRDGLPLREIAKRTGLSRNTIRRWLRSGQSEPVYPKRVSPSRLDPYRAQLETWLRADSGFRIRPASHTASIRRIRISLVKASTPTSAKCPAYVPTS